MSTKLKPEQEIKELSKKKSNKNCFDCGRSGPQQNVNTTLNTLVCTQCAGLHRKYNHKVKTINMSSWSQAEVDALEAGGNKRAKKMWLASYDEGKSYQLDPEDPANVDRFMQLCYVEKKWARPAGAAANDREDSSRKGSSHMKKPESKRTPSMQVSDRAFTDATFPSSVTITQSSNYPSSSSSHNSSSSHSHSQPQSQPVKQTSATDLGIDFLSNLTISSPAVSNHGQQQKHAPSPYENGLGNSNSAGLFDSPQSSGNTNGNGSLPAGVYQLLESSFLSVQSQFSCSTSTLESWVETAIEQFVQKQQRNGGGVSDYTSPQSRSQSNVSSSHSHAAVASPPHDAFDGIDLPEGDEADSGNPFDSDDDEDDDVVSPNGSTGLPSNVGAGAGMMPGGAGVGAYGAHTPISPALQQQMSPQQQQQAYMYQQQQAAYQQQMMYQQQQMMAAQQQQYGAGAGYGQQMPYGAQGAQLQGSGYGAQQQPGAFMPPQQTQPLQQQQPAKPDLFAGLGGLNGF